MMFVPFPPTEDTLCKLSPIYYYGYDALSSKNGSMKFSLPHVSSACIKDTVEIGVEINVQIVTQAVNA